MVRFWEPSPREVNLLFLLLMEQIFGFQIARATPFPRCEPWQWPGPCSCLGRSQSGRLTSERSSAAATRRIHKEPQRCSRASIGVCLALRFGTAMAAATVNFLDDLRCILPPPAPPTHYPEVPDVPRRCKSARERNQICPRGK
jgi:hypothetical protein